MNRNQKYSDYEAPLGTPELLRKDFMIEKGRAYGLDVSMKYENMRWYLWGAYSLGYVNKDYEDVDKVLHTYRTHYDRRHNVNLMATYTAGSKHQWEISARWNFGTGFPFTQVSAFYEKLPYDNIYFDPYTESGYLGIIYDELNTGQLPTYHRLDLDVKRKFYFTENVILEADFSITNVYDRRCLLSSEKKRLLLLYSLRRRQGVSYILSP